MGTQGTLSDSNTSKDARSRADHHIRVREQLRRLLDEGRHHLDEAAARAILAGFLPFGEAKECKGIEEAVDAAETIGYPVVVKGESPDLLHKSDHGLVVTGCEDRTAVTKAATEVLGRLTGIDASAPSVSVQRQLSGIELAIGFRRDELGAVCMVAAGGTLIELLADSAVGLAPLSEKSARQMLDSLRMRPLLDGYRGDAMADLESLVTLMVRVSELADAVPEITEFDLNPVFVGSHGCSIADAAGTLAFAEAAQTVDDPAPPRALRALFEPRTIAIIGASRDERKPGGLLLRYLRRHGFGGRIVAVNPRPLDLADVPTYRSVSAIPEAVDLACIAVPAARVQETVQECVEAGIPAGIIFSAGFAEEGADGRAAQDAVLKTAGGRFRFVGPNSIGLASPGERMFATFGMALEVDSIPRGNIGFISQSGAIATSLISRGGEFGLAFSHWISGGNEADLGMGDYLDYLVDDPTTEVICVFLEAIRRPSSFRSACRRAVAARKPVVVFKTGRSEAGRAAAASHTGALTGSQAAYEAFLSDAGALQVDTLAELFCAAKGLLMAGPVDGKRIGVISMSGGACSIIADACSDAGLDVPDLPAAVRARFADLLPSFGGTRNPIDLTAEGIRNPDLVREAVEIMRTSGVVDLVLLQLSTNADPAAREMAEDLTDLLAIPARVPVLIGRLGSPNLAPEAMEVYGQGGIHVFSWPDELVQAAKACVNFGAQVGRGIDDLRQEVAA